MSNEKYNDDYHAANEALIKRETQKFERAKARAEALENNMARGLAAALREQRKKLADESLKAVNRGENGAITENERRMIDAARQGIDNVRIDEGIITGFDIPAHLRGGSDEDDF